MAETDETPDERIERLERELAAARGESLQAQAGRRMPDIVVEVLPENTVNHDGEHHEEGDTFAVEGPTAVALAQGGHVKIVGSAE